MQKQFNEKNIKTVFLQIDQGTNLYRECCSVDISEHIDHHYLKGFFITYLFKKDMYDDASVKMSVT